MSTIRTRMRGQLPANWADDPFRYGWREVRTVGPDGKEKSQNIPLTEEEILHPQEDDHITQGTDHQRWCFYLSAVLRIRVAAMPGTAVYHDVRTDWEAGDVEPHGPDFVVYGGVEEELTRSLGTIPVETLGWRPLAVFEITSPSTRNNDLNRKRTEYHQAGIPLYVVIDGLAESTAPDLFALRWTPGGYEQELPNEQGRLWVEPVRIWLGWQGNDLVAWNEDGIVIPDVAELYHRAEETEQRIAEAIRAQRKADRERRRAERAQQDAERQIEALQAELRRLRGEE
jgi:colicin import membrane protein